MKKNQQYKLKSFELEITAAKSRILNFFYDFPEEEFSFNEICEATNTSKTTAKEVVEELIANRWVERTVVGKLWRLRLNVSDPRVKNYKIVHNLDLIFGTNLIEFLTSNYPRARALILFGSYRKGDDLSKSDIDVALEIPGLARIQVIQGGVIDKLGYRENVAVNLHLFSRQTVDPNLFANIANGIVLHGFLEVKP